MELCSEVKMKIYCNQQRTKEDKLAKMTTGGHSGNLMKMFGSSLQRIRLRRKKLIRKGADRYQKVQIGAI